VMRILTAALTISLLAAPLSGQALTTDVGIRGHTSPQVSLAARIDAALALPLRTMEMRDVGMSDEAIGHLLDEMAAFNLPATAQLAVLTSARDAVREGRPPVEYVTSARRLQEAGQPVVSQRPDPAHARRHAARHRNWTWGRSR
jgi:hypothetical protein